jgi:uncharacterized protein (TIGR00730 family)
MPYTVTVYCASSRKVDKKYFEATIALADELLSKNARVIYGGGAVGLMGALADRYIEKGGDIIGIIPEFMVKVEWAHQKVKNMHIVNDMHERKRKLIENTDAVIALPGGVGTLEELSEVICLKQLGKFSKPILLLNTDGFYTLLHQFLEKMAREHFLSKDHLNIWQLIDKPEDFWHAIENKLEWFNDLGSAQI